MRARPHSPQVAVLSLLCKSGFGFRAGLGGWKTLAWALPGVYSEELLPGSQSSGRAPRGEFPPQPLCHPGHAVESKLGEGSRFPLDKPRFILSAGKGG